MYIQCTAFLAAFGEKKSCDEPNLLLNQQCFTEMTISVSTKNLWPELKVQVPGIRFSLGLLLFFLARVLQNVNCKVNLQNTFLPLNQVW